jgi:hypothetical protein
MLAVMSEVSIALGLATLICGLRAAYLWRRSTQVPIEPKGFEPVVPEMQQIWWKIAEENASAQSAGLNRRAAWWTAVAAFLAFATVVVGAWLNSN